MKVHSNMRIRINDQNLFWFSDEFNGMLIPGKVERYGRGLLTKMLIQRKAI